MTELTREISQEDYVKAKEKGVHSILNEDILLNYGVHSPQVVEENGKYYLKYEPMQYKGAGYDYNYYKQ